MGCGNWLLAAFVAGLAVRIGLLQHVWMLRPGIPLNSWDGKINLTGSSTVFASSVPDVQLAVQRAAATGGRIKTVGAGHSWSRSAAPEGATVLTLGPGTDSFQVISPNVVRVGAGMRLVTFLDKLNEQGLAMHNLPSVNSQTIGGLLATACHGSGIGSPGLSSAVMAVGVVAGNGTSDSGLPPVLELRKEDLDLWKEHTANTIAPDDKWISLWSQDTLAAVSSSGIASPSQLRERALLFDAARAHLGAIGVVVWVELRVVPAFDLVAEEMLAKTASVFGSVAPTDSSTSTATWPSLATFRAECLPVVPTSLAPELQSRPECAARAINGVKSIGECDIQCLAGRYEFLKLWVVPHTPYTVVHGIRRRTADDEPVSTNWAWVTAVWDDILTDVFDFSMFLGARLPWIQPQLNSLSAQSFAAPRVRVSHSHRLQVIPFRVPFHTETEWSVPARHSTRLYHNFTRIATAAAASSGFVQEWRFVAPDDTLASPDQAGPDGAEPRIHITLGLRDPELSGHSQAYFGSMERAAAAVGGRPHWAKRMGVTEVSSGPEAVSALYPPGQIEAMAEAAAILDPHRIFRNSWLDSILGAHDHAVV